MSVPSWTPSYFDAIGGEEYGSEHGTAWAIDCMLSVAKNFVDWFVDDHFIPFEIRPAGPNMIAFEGNGITGEIVLDVEDGWLRATATVGGRQVFVGYIERRYEEYEVWPPGATDKEIYEPGRLGKHLMWASLNSTYWPDIKPLAGEGVWVNVQHDEPAMIERQKREGRYD